jgi:hypothetical protein
MNAQATGTHVVFVLCGKTGCWEKAKHVNHDGRGYVVHSCSLTHFQEILNTRRYIYKQHAPKEA